MAKQTLIAGIDIGSNRVACVVGAKDDNARLLKVLSGASVSCRDGIKAGAVINVQEATMAIDRAFEETEKAAGSSISEVIAAISGSFVKALNKKGAANVSHTNREITEETVANAIDSARKQIKLEADQEVLQIIPKEFILNQQKGIQNPIGMEGTFIEVDVHALVAPTSNIATIVKAMNSVDIPCDEKVYGYYAASDILATKEEKELGCIVVDFGGLTTGIVHYLDGIIRYTGEIIDNRGNTFGSDWITKDIMHKLRATFAVSKGVKELYGAAWAYPGLVNEEFTYQGADGRTSKKYDKNQLVEIICPRVEQLLGEIEKQMKSSPCGAQFLSGGIILTGGGSKLAGLQEAFERYFGCTVRIGVPNPEKVVGPEEIVSDPSFTAAIGALASTFTNSYSRRYSGSGGPGFWSKLIKWFEETF